MEAQGDGGEGEVEGEAVGKLKLKLKLRRELTWGRTSVMRSTSNSISVSSSGPHPRSSAM